MVRALHKFLLTLVALCLFATPALAEPALWAVRGKDSTVYLFGTVHVLRKDTNWRSPKIDAAFARADDLWLEITDDDPEKAQDLMERLGVDRATPLSRKAPAKDIARLRDVATALGAPGGESMFETMQPWFAGLTISLIPIVKAGFDPQSGVDRALKTQAQAGGKPLHAFETAEGQMRILAELPKDVQLEFLQSALDDFDKGPAKLDALIANWRDGDVDALARSELSDMKTEQPHLYKMLLIDRNQRWTEVIAERLKRPGVSFMAVGAAHLAGEDSVQAMLEKRGLKAVRE